jgi:serine/threonine-protein kinase
MTPLYASPEQKLCERVTFASDIYSLGVLMYELLTGHPPLDIELSSPCQVDKRLGAIVQKTLERDPARRFATADALADEIERYLPVASVRSLAEQAWSRLHRAVAERSHSRIATTPSLLVMGVVVGGLALAELRGGSSDGFQIRLLPIAVSSGHAGLHWSSP